MSEVVLINEFTVPEGRDREFLELWLAVNRHMRAQPGYLDHRLHRALDDSPPARYVNVAIWESAEAHEAAHETERFRELLSQPAWRDFPGVPALFELVADKDTEPALT